MNDETNAQLLLKPIPPETFYILYQQGWRVDQLFRLMVDRIEFAVPTRKGGCAVEVIRNVPPPLYSDGRGGFKIDTSRDLDGLRHYVTFLRISAVVYELQRHGNLLIRGETNFVPYNSNSAAPKDKPEAKDIETASEKGSSWEINEKGVTVLGQKVVTPVFYLNPMKAGTDKAGKALMLPDTETIAEFLRGDGNVSALKQGDALANTLAVLAAGFSIEGSHAAGQEADSPCGTGPGSGTSHLVMRSLIGVMAAAAQEQVPFDGLLALNPAIPPSASVTAASDEAATNFREAVPPIELLPALRLRWSGQSERADAPLMELEYRGTRYMVADVRSPATPEDQYWNRDMFRLIAELTSQVTVDISKFQVPDILQLHTN